MRLSQAVMGRIVGFGFTVLLFCLTLSSVAGQSNKPTEVLPNWETGQKTRYEIVKTRKKTQGELVTLNMTARTGLEIEVLEVNDEGYTLAWTFGETEYDDPKFREDPLVKQMSNLLKGHRIILELDPQAIILGVENWKEIQGSTEEMIEVLTKSLEAEGLNKTKIEKLGQQVASMFATKQQITELCTREAQIMFMAIGVELVPSQPLAFEDKLPNPFGGEPFPTRAAFTLKENDADSDETTIKWRQTLVPDDARRIMEATLKTLAERIGGPVPDADQLLKFSVEDQAQFVFEKSTGWIHSATHKRSTRAGGNTQEDTVTFSKKVE